jgi:hypothetical protein
MSRWSALYQLFLARLREFYREPMVVFWVYGFPVFLAVALGLAFSGGLPWARLSGDRVPVAIEEDADPTEAASLRDELQAHGINAQLLRRQAAEQRMGVGGIGLLVVPGPQRYDYYFDPARSESELLRYRVDDVVQRRHTGSPPWPTEDHRIDTPGDRYIDFLIPGLMGFNLLTGGLWGVGYVIVDLRVRKLLKRFLATPMRPGDFLLSIVGGRMLFVVPEMLVLLLVGRLGFGVPIRGSLLTLALAVFLGGSAFAGLGLLVACRTERAETASGLINLLVIPAWMFSGTFFSTARFPQAVQPLVQASPLTHLNDALREIMLDGAPLSQVAGHLVVLAVCAGASFLLALKWFRWH